MWVSVHNILSLLLLLPHAFSLLQCFMWSLSQMIKSVMSCSITSWVLRLQFLLDDQILSFPRVAASFRPHPRAATWGIPWAAVCRSTLNWYPTCFRGTTCLTVVFTDFRAISAQVPGTPPPLLHHWFWDLQSCFSHSSLSWLLHSILFPFLRYFITEAPPASLIGSAVTSGRSLLELTGTGSVGNSWSLSATENSPGKSNTIILELWV